MHGCAPGKTLVYVCKCDCLRTCWHALKYIHQSYDTVQRRKRGVLFLVAFGMVMAASTDSPRSGMHWHVTIHKYLLLHPAVLQMVQYHDQAVHNLLYCW